MGDFFIWCAGSDKTIISKCSDSERTKHIGFGTLVIVPALLAFVSMTYALSTLGQMKENPAFCYLGGFAWGVMIFCFDRFIVSTHRKKVQNEDELKNIVFYLRLFFSLILGIAISHPLVLLYFDGSIQDEIQNEITSGKSTHFDDYNKNKIKPLLDVINEINKNEKEKEQRIDDQHLLLTSEIKGPNQPQSKWAMLTSGIEGIGSRAKIQKDREDHLMADFAKSQRRDSIEIDSIRSIIKILEQERDSEVARISLRTDYLRREVSLDRLKNGNGIIVITQWILMLLFVFVDVLPVTFKTFAPFGMYDKIAMDDGTLINDLDTASRKSVLQEAYNKISSIYAEEKELSRNPDLESKKIRDLLKRHHVVKNIAIGLILGIVTIIVLVFLYLFEGMSLERQIREIIIIELLVSCIASMIIELSKRIF
jgi:hypothetical protein